MRTIYIDSNFVCHADYVEGRTAVETDTLDGVCDTALPFYIYVPVGSTYEKPNGVIVKGEFVQCLDVKSADMEQLKSKLADADAALAELGVSVDG